MIENCRIELGIAEDDLVLPCYEQRSVEQEKKNNCLEPRDLVHPCSDITSNGLSPKKTLLDLVQNTEGQT